MSLNFVSIFQKSRHKINLPQNGGAGVTIDGADAAKVAAPAPMLIERGGHPMTQHGLNRATMCNDENPFVGKLCAEALPRHLNPLGHRRQRLAPLRCAIKRIGKTGAGVIGVALHHFTVGQALPIAMIGLAPIGVTHQWHGTVTSDGAGGGLAAAKASVNDNIDSPCRKMPRQSLRLLHPIRR